MLEPISEERLSLLRRADAIFIEEIRNFGWYDKIWQAGVVFLPVQSVGGMGDDRTYEWTVATSCSFKRWHDSRCGSSTLGVAGDSFYTHN